ncbi:uncharacterized protein I303_108490 [Kwoniella dejecticola CBS 10117]|uniref:Yeast cell wall synthesis Kre9/Knh1-like N-terminal domain-containing protein n=1 Tax=Kwoniella dejecticola CBS 10117 TaxID=1296121 RepID=A0A1A5ZX94_9TREE|nr:uncharacterized protein I303_07186 [Kwoniella dejecticola CBS 10117]OBR82427.1 hypothetical protein I303_07186 [Kwoniella dejecticola CBS 10117]
MYKLTAALAALSALGLTGAITVESPDRDTVWQSGTSSQTISWKAVSTDADSFVVQLVNQAGFLTDSPVTLISNQSTGSSDIVNTATVTFPNGNWPEGTAFQINFVTSEKSNAAILAQSNQFNITSGGSSSSSSSSSASSSSTSGSATSTGTSPTTLSGTSSAVTVTSTDASATGNIPNSSNGTTTAGTSGASPVAASGLLATLVGVVGLAAAALV